MDLVLNNLQRCTIKPNNQTNPSFLIHRFKSSSSFRQSEAICFQLTGKHILIYSLLTSPKKKKKKEKSLLSVNPYELLLVPYMFLNHKNDPFNLSLKKEKKKEKRKEKN